MRKNRQAPQPFPYPAQNVGKSGKPLRSTGGDWNRARALAPTSDASPDSVPHPIASASPAAPTGSARDLSSGRVGSSSFAGSPAFFSSTRSSACPFSRSSDSYISPIIKPNISLSFMASPPEKQNKYDFLLGALGAVGAPVAAQRFSAVFACPKRFFILGHLGHPPQILQAFNFLPAPFFRGTWGTFGADFFNVTN